VRWLAYARPEIIERQVFAVLIEVDVAGVDREQGLTVLREHVVPERFGPGSSPNAGASVVRCEVREVAATA
jgi:hypothetical protein